MPTSAQRLSCRGDGYAELSCSHGHWGRVNRNWPRCDGADLAPDGLQRLSPGAPRHRGRRLDANAIVTAHNHVLRSWLCGTIDDAPGELEAVARDVTARLWPARPSSPEDAQVVVLRTGRDLDDLLPELERVLRG
jgi:hypothetical protein